MSKVIRISDSFYNIRGSFKVGRLDVGTHISLVRRKSGKWLMLDSHRLDDAVKAEVDQLTNNGRDIEAIINLHPFHTASCQWAHEAYPEAALYGSARHHAKFPDLPWQSGLVEDAAVRAQWADDLDLRIPDGVDFISKNESVHFSSVVAYHPESKTCHVDDTFMFIPTPKALFCFKQGTLQLHPTLSSALKPVKGAAQEFRLWTRAVANDWDMQNLCAAHTGALLSEKNTGQTIKKRLLWALKVAEPVLTLHELRYGKAAKAPANEAAAK